MTGHAKMTGSTCAATRGSGLARVLLIAGLLVLGGVAYAYAIHPNLFLKNFGVVDDGKLYRAGELTPAATRTVVEQNKIKTIIDLGAYDKDPAGERAAERTAKALGVERRVFRLEGDGRGNPNAYVETLRIITDPSKQPVLVHCSAGAQRTGACVILYRTIVQGRSRADVMAEAYTHLHDPADNPYLTPYLDEWAQQIERAFRAGPDVLIDGQPKAEIVSPAKDQ